MSDINEHIKQIVNKVINGSATETERAELSEYLTDADDEQVKLTLLGVENWENAANEPFSELKKKDLLIFIGDKKTVRGRFNFPIWRYAAVLLLFLGAAYLVFINNDKQSEKIAKSDIVQNKVLDSTKMIVLTLSDGRTVALADDVKGHIAEDGTAEIMVLEDGTVIYKDELSQHHAGNEVLYNTLKTPRGVKTRITLPDGSRVSLNAASSIKYPIKFPSNSRLVELEGEAYFDIVPNASAPFVVKSGSQNLLVLGTIFNVNEYLNEIKTTLIEGSVKVAHNNTNNTKLKDGILMKPAQQLRVELNEGMSKHFDIMDDVNMEEVTAWTRGYFYFNQAKIEDILLEIQRWYDVNPVVVANVTHKFSGKFSHENSIEEVIKILELTGKVKLKVEGKNLIVDNY